MSVVEGLSRPRAAVYRRMAEIRLESGDRAGAAALLDRAVRAAAATTQPAATTRPAVGTTRPAPTTRATAARVPATRPAIATTAATRPTTAPMWAPEAAEAKRLLEEIETAKLAARVRGAAAVRAEAARLFAAFRDAPVAPQDRALAFGPLGELRVLAGDAPAAWAWCQTIPEPAYRRLVARGMLDALLAEVGGPPLQPRRISQFDPLLDGIQ